MDREQLKALIRDLLAEKVGEMSIKHFSSNVNITEQDRLNTGDPLHRVYTHDLFDLKQSPRLGLGVMYMEKTEFPWHLGYDEIDYVLEGSLTIKCAQGELTAKAGEGILIPKDSDIRFSVPDKARFLYITYPADWQNQGG